MFLGCIVSCMWVSRYMWVPVSLSVSLSCSAVQMLMTKRGKHLHSWIPVLICPLSILSKPGCSRHAQRQIIPTHRELQGTKAWLWLCSSCRVLHCWSNLWCHFLMTSYPERSDFSQASVPLALPLYKIPSVSSRLRFFQINMLHPILD